MSSSQSPSYNDLLNILADAEPQTQDAGRVSVDPDAQALPSYEDMMDIFADFDEVETVPSGTQVRAQARSTCQSVEQEKCVELQPASESKELPQASRRPVFERSFGGQSTSDKYLTDATKPRQSTLFEEKDSDRLPTYENMLCIFDDLELRETCSNRSGNQQDVHKFATGELKSLRGMKKFRYDCVVPPYDETPSSVISVGLVCK